MIPSFIKRQGQASIYPTHSAGLKQPSWLPWESIFANQNRHISPHWNPNLAGHESGDGCCLLAASRLIELWITSWCWCKVVLKVGERRSTGDWIGFFNRSSLRLAGKIAPRSQPNIGSGLNRLLVTWHEGWWLLPSSCFHSHRPLHHFLVSVLDGPSS